MVQTINNNKIDFSFIPSYFCNLRCPFCMYNCSSERREKLDINKLDDFIKTIDWEWINSIGFYGGEIVYNLDICEHILRLIPEGVPKFCITNGSWSRDVMMTSLFTDFCRVFNIKCAISSTPYHTKYQNKKIIDKCIESELFFVKEEEQSFLSMGRNKKEGWECSKKCLCFRGAMRYALTPIGNIIFQSCDGVYPIIGINYPSFEIIKNHYFLIKGR